jgi:hypothetical protein
VTNRTWLFVVLLTTSLIALAVSSPVTAAHQGQTYEEMFSGEAEESVRNFLIGWAFTYFNSEQVDETGGIEDIYFLRINETAGKFVSLTPESTSPKNTQYVTTQNGFSRSDLTKIEEIQRSGHLDDFLNIPHGNESSPPTTSDQVLRPAGRINCSPTPVTVDSPVTCDAKSSTAPKGPVYSYAWDLDSDSDFERRGPTQQLSFTEVGSQRIRVRVTSNQGVSANVSKYIDVKQPTTSSPSPEPTESHESGSRTSSETEPSTPQPSKPAEATLQLTGTRTQITTDELASLTFSGVNLVGNEPMTIQLILQSPSGVSIASVTNADSGSNQYTAVFTLAPGESRNVRVALNANQPGTHVVNGIAAYYFGDNKTETKRYSQSLELQVQPEQTQISSTTIGTEPTTNGSGPGFSFFGVVVSVVAVISVLRKPND